MIAENEDSYGRKSLFDYFLLFFVSTWIALTGWPLFAASYKGNGFAIDFGLSMRPCDFGFGLLSACVFFFLLFVFIVSYEALRIRFELKPFPYEYYYPNSDFEIVLFFFWPTVDVIAKEIFCNGLVFTATAKALHRIGWPCHELWAIAASAVAFMCVHLDINGAVLWLIGGVVAATTRYLSASLTAVILGHMMVYILPFILILFIISFW